jgi:amino acid adenylation domain-containing protein
MDTSSFESNVCGTTQLFDLQSSCLPESVARRAAETPEALALTAGTQTLSYRELDDRADRLARYLRSLGVRRDVVVGLWLPRCLDMVVGALGIWKAGGASVLMDPDWPHERLAFVLEDAQSRVLITNASLARQIPRGTRVIVDPGAPEIAALSEGPPVVKVEQDDLAYVIYTSGSTGQPKGVEIPHGGLVNLVSWHRQAFSVSAADRASHLAGLSFDAAVWELWPYLAVGASVHLVDEFTRNSAELLRDWFVANRITVSFVPTPLAEELFRVKWPPNTVLRIMLTGGDALHHYPPASLPFVLINNYGPVECTVVATSGAVPPDRHDGTLPPIGRPIANTQIHLLDEQLRPVPPGGVGEIYIAGAGLARGYRNRPDLTAGKFISDPFSAKPGSRLYKTGDLARMLPDGQIAFLGRVDEQIKIRGFRIEPNEIVCALNQHPVVCESLVLAREDSAGDKCLVAYLVLKPDSGVTPTRLRGYLRRRLPEYMLPSVFVRLEAFPLTPNGKIDRAALPAPDPANTLHDECSTDLPTPTQQHIIEILRALLGHEEIGLNDDFFLLGGHSLLGAQLIAKLREMFGVELALRTVFDAPTVVALAEEIERLAAKRGEAQRGGSGHVCLSSDPTPWAECT